MALDPKWSEEARKNVKETSIDERMYKRITEQRKHLAEDRLNQKPQTPTPTPTVPAYPGSLRKSEEKAPAGKASAETDTERIQEIYDRIMERVGAIVRSELEKLKD